jgi:hypothetical protein
MRSSGRLPQDTIGVRVGFGLAHETSAPSVEPMRAWTMVSALFDDEGDAAWAAARPRRHRSRPGGQGHNRSSRRALAQSLAEPAEYATRWDNSRVPRPVSGVPPGH